MRSGNPSHDNGQAMDLQHIPHDTSYTNTNQSQYTLLKTSSFLGFPIARPAGRDYWFLRVSQQCQGDHMWATINPHLAFSISQAMNFPAATCHFLLLASTPTLLIASIYLYASPVLCFHIAQVEICTLACHKTLCPLTYVHWSLCTPEFTSPEISQTTPAMSVV